MFLSFFVPNTSTTMSSTMSQCQMLNEPMMTPERKWRRTGWSLRAR
jgi:hypothetical protein